MTKKLDIYLITYTKDKSTGCKDYIKGKKGKKYSLKGKKILLREKNKALKSLEENIGELLYDLRVCVVNFSVTLSLEMNTEHRTQ